MGRSCLRTGDVMKIACVGVGYVGLVVGVCLADLGNEVIGVGRSAEKIKGLNNGKVPIYEPGLNEVLDRNLKEKRISFSTDIAEAIRFADVIFIGVGTPPDKDHKADLSQVLDVAEKIGKHMDRYKVVVDKSTVPVGTAEKVKETIKKNQPKDIDVDVVSNPEFLREGEAIDDFLIPDRIVVGVDSERAKGVMERVYGGIARTDRPLMFTSVKSAEVIKYASNAMLATRISFMNELACLSEKVGADIKEVAKGMGLDKRIGPRFLQAGVGYGGSCFPKDVKALIQTMKENGCVASLLDAVEEVNARQKRSLVPKLEASLPELKGKTIAVWGLAFKPKTDDMREAPSIEVIKELLKKGALVKAFDPVAEENAKRIFSEIIYCDHPYDAADGADALIVVTEWNEFRNLDKEKLKSLLRTPIVIDGRNIYDRREMEGLGFTYQGVGR